MAAMKLDFIDLTVEPPAGASWRINPRAVRSALDRYGMQVVGHTAYYLPIASAFPQVRKAAVEELRRCIDVFADIGARWMNLHPDRYTPMHDRAFLIAQNLDSLAELSMYARNMGVGLMIENLPGDYNNARQLGELLDAMPELGLHLDIGHANLLVEHNTTPDLCAKYAKRLAHVHAHDNKGGAGDLHLPIGAGNIDWPSMVRALKRAQYDDTITLEVFSEDRHFLAYSRDRLRVLWDETS